MSEEHTAICDQCGERVPMVGKLTVAGAPIYQYPPGYREIEIQVSMPGEPLILYDKRVAVCGTTCADTWLQQYGLQAMGTWAGLRVEPNE